VRAARLGGIGTARRVMSIKVRLASDAPLDRQENRPKMRVTLNGQPPVAPLQLPPPAPEAPELLPPKVKAFWDYDEDAHRARTPWRYAESPNEQAIRVAKKGPNFWNFRER
jgi:hypothetical protein